MRRAWRCSLMFGLGIWAGCDGDAFLCEQDVDCTGAGVPGVCQPSGFCSFSDGWCTSGQRYGEFAGASLAGECVEFDEAEPAWEDEGRSDTAGDDEPEPSPDEPEPNPDEPEPSPDEPEPNPDEPEPNPTNLECQFDDFDDQRIDSFWCSDVPPGIEVSESDDVIRVAMVPESWEGGEQFGHLHSCQSAPLLDIEVTARIARMPRLSSDAEGYLEVGNESFRLGLSVYDGELSALEYDGADYSYWATLPYDADAHRYWRVRGSADGLVAEISADGAGWTHLFTYELDLADQRGEARLAVWAGDAPSVVDTAEFDWLEVCSLPQ